MKPRSKVNPPEDFRMRHVECPHSVTDLLEKERRYIPAIGKASDGLVWCDDCKTWVGFEVDWTKFNASQANTQGKQG